MPSLTQKEGILAEGPLPVEELREEDTGAPVILQRGKRGHPLIMLLPNLKIRQPWRIMSFLKVIVPEISIRQCPPCRGLLYGKARI
jgi:hypothetical protein